MAKSMCQWCNRAPHKPHLGNCPALTGVEPKSNPGYNSAKDRTGAYLRRPRECFNPCGPIYPHVIYLAETRPAPDSPAALYLEDNTV